MKEYQEDNQRQLSIAQSNSEAPGFGSASLKPPPIQRSYGESAHAQEHATTSNQEPVSDVIPHVNNQFYAHGGFMGAGPELMADPKWNRILQVLMPDVHSDVTEAINGEEGSEVVILMFENNPVTAAYGMARSQQIDDDPTNGKTDAVENLKAFEWDAFLPPSHVEAFKNETDPGKKSQHAEKIVDGLLIAHGNTSQTLKENVVGLRQYENVRKTDKSAQGGLEPGAWMDIFGRAMMLGSSADWENLANNMEDEERNHSDTDKTIDQTFKDQMTFKDVVDLYKELYGKEFFSVILDVKSRDASAAVLTAVIQELNKRGVHVYGVGSFISDEIAGLDEVEQIIDGEMADNAKEVMFYHGAGNLQDACLSGQVGVGDTVMFNAGSLIDYVPYYTGEAKKASYAIDAEVISQLDQFKRHYGFELGVYVQENHIDDRAATLITEVTNANPELFSLGFAWGGVSGETAADIEPSLGAAKTGLAGQYYTSRSWNKSKGIETLSPADAKEEIKEASRNEEDYMESVEQAYDAIRKCTDHKALQSDAEVHRILSRMMRGKLLVKAHLLLEFGKEGDFPSYVQLIWSSIYRVGTDEHMLFSTLERLTPSELEVLKSIPGLKDALDSEVSFGDQDRLDELWGE